ncbi:hypothetical protein EYZ11_007686 [Aspergillus tanneri]|uniref:Taspase, threonine aspartase, 1 n=1 Tax=Aspergillus tanneri TaxID=1220188 RepID=A0A4V6RQS3_9EURO|nr:hypothetical protein EYZ11_007686 [Aspergillus tanneri]
MSPPRKGNVSAIFVHAGAGFHSVSNEKAHLETCENAAKVAMSVLKNGGSAVDAVEIAIMLLEDAEITNAGYGSNLTIDGLVECDATIINHLGQSGAVGAVSNVKNPISLARVIFESSMRPLSLQRVPPNFLVGQGATDFAYEHRLVVLPDDGLISAAARERWHRWQQDLESCESGERQQKSAHHQNGHFKAWLRRPVNIHPAQLLSCPLSAQPPSSGPPMCDMTHDANLPADDTHFHPRSFGVTPPADVDMTSSPSSRARDGEYVDGMIPQPEQVSTRIESNILPDSTTAANASGMDNNNPIPQPVGTNTHYEQKDSAPFNLAMDQINDTVGAIAIDSYGNTAAGSSSGGIGMKHRGRIGPAALVGIGTSIIPADPSDLEKTCVAVVTSGTGEHITTTMAASTCASRIYYNQRKCEDGTFEEVTEDEAMKTMIETEFMGN